MNSAEASWREFRAVLQALHHRTPVEAVEVLDQLLARRFFYASPVDGLPVQDHQQGDRGRGPDGAAITVATLATAFVDGRVEGLS